MMLAFAVETPAANPRIPRLWPFKGAYYGWAVLWASTTAAFGMEPMFGPALGVFFSSIEEELGWDWATISLAFTIGSMTGSVVQALTGRLLDRYGGRMVVAAAGVIIALAMLGLSWMQEPRQFWLAFGAGAGRRLRGFRWGRGCGVELVLAGGRGSDGAAGSVHGVRGDFRGDDGDDVLAKPPEKAG